MADTGHGATLTLATTGAVGAVRSMTLPNWVIEAIEDTDLSTTNFKTFISSDLSDPGELDCEIVFDGTVAVPSRGVAETVTVTFPAIATTNNATLAGTGFITETKLPDLSTGELQISRIKIKYDGKTEPAFTAET